MNQHRFFLFFKDSNIERDFCKFYDSETRIFIRIGIILSFLNWVVISYIVGMVLFPDYFANLNSKNLPEQNWNIKKLCAQNVLTAKGCCSIHDIHGYKLRKLIQSKTRQACLLTTAISVILNHLSTS